MSSKPFRFCFPSPLNSFVNLFLKESAYAFANTFGAECLALLNRGGYKWFFFLVSCRWIFLQNFY